MKKNFFYLILAIIILAIFVSGVFFIFVNELFGDDAWNHKTDPKYQITYINATSDNIKVDFPPVDAVVGKEFSVIGQAGGWYFEGSFPVQVLEKNGNVLTTRIAQAQGDWMTSNLVPFKADIIISSSYKGPATLVLKKDNPSDMRQYDASISFPITIGY